MQVVLFESSVASSVSDSSDEDNRIGEDFFLIFSVEEIYKQKLLDMRESRDRDIEADVKRVKEEANEAIVQLRTQLLDGRKPSVTQEMSSLQEVVEMGTDEVRNLMEQLARATQELEQAEIVKEKLREVVEKLERMEKKL